MTSLDLSSSIKLQLRYASSPAALQIVEHWVRKIVHQRLTPSNGLSIHLHARPWNRRQHSNWTRSLSKHALHDCAERLMPEVDAFEVTSQPPRQRATITLSGEEQPKQTASQKTSPEGKAGGSGFHISLPELWNGPHPVKPPSRTTSIPARFMFRQYTESAKKPVQSAVQGGQTLDNNKWGKGDHSHNTSLRPTKRKPRNILLTCAGASLFGAPRHSRKASKVSDLRQSDGGTAVSRTAEPTSIT